MMPYLFVLKKNRKRNIGIMPFVLHISIADNTLPNIINNRSINSSQFYLKLNISVMICIETSIDTKKHRQR
jgi:hypothetical protein